MLYRTMWSMLVRTQKIMSLLKVNDCGKNRLNHKKLFRVSYGMNQYRHKKLFRTRTTRMIISTEFNHTHYLELIFIMRLVNVSKHKHFVIIYKKEHNKKGHSFEVTFFYKLSDLFQHTLHIQFGCTLLYFACHV